LLPGDGGKGRSALRVERGGGEIKPQSLPAIVLTTAGHQVTKNCLGITYFASQPADGGLKTTRRQFCMDIQDKQDRRKLTWLALRALNGPDILHRWIGYGTDCQVPPIFGGWKG
jgi:hypothetical protein